MASDHDDADGHARARLQVAPPVRYLEALTSRDLDVGRLVLLVPVGATEQHGGHLPLGTDTLIASALAEAVAHHEPDLVVAPSIAVTASGEHAGFRGTLSIGTAATAATLIELVRSADWVSRVTFVNAHGGNAEAIRLAVERSHSDGRASVTAWSPNPSRVGDLHAGFDETSVMLHLQPSLVHMDAAHGGPSPTIAELRQLGVRAVSPNGVLGDPTSATAAAGAEIFASWVASLRDHLAQPPV